VNLLIAAHPTPVLMMAGKDDEVFKAEWMRSMASEASRGYAAGGTSERFRFFLDEGGHAYTIAQALNSCAGWTAGCAVRPAARPSITRREMAPRRCAIRVEGTC
jgi:hypothetical protein